jgi:hypothetical protein
MTGIKKSDIEIPEQYKNEKSHSERIIKLK